MVDTFGHLRGLSPLQLSRLVDPVGTHSVAHKSRPAAARRRQLHGRARAGHLPGQRTVLRTTAGPKEWMRRFHGVGSKKIAGLHLRGGDRTFTVFSFNGAPQALIGCQAT